MENLKADYAWGEYAIELGHNLRRARGARGLSQEQVALRVGISSKTYQKYETGHSKPGTPMNPQLVNLVCISHVLEVPVEELLPVFDPGLPAAG